MSLATQVIQSALPELRLRYATRLRAQSSELLDFISRCERGRLSDEICAEARNLAHSLCGTGSTFGFPDISDTARYLETAIDCGPPHSVQTYIELALELLRACDVAIQAVPEDGPPRVAALESAASMVVAQTLILIVNADRTTTGIANELFDARMQVLHAANTDEALGLLVAHNPGVLIFDMQTKEGSVNPSLEKLYAHARKQNVPVIALAPTRHAAAVAHGLSGGAIQCIVKPVSFGELYGATRATVERRRMKVLVGDDDVIVREVLANRFKAYGFSVVGANDGAHVLDLAGKHKPSIIVLDRIMPGLEGVAVLQMLKANPQTHEIPVVVLSSKRKATEISEARRAGAVDYIVKPFTPDQVVIRCMHELGMTPRPMN